MKSSALIPLAVLGLVPTVAAEIKAAPSAEEVNARRQTGTTAYHRAGLKVPAKKVEVRLQSADLMDTTRILVGPNGYTLVPADSVVATGRLLTLAKEAPASGKLMRWEEFIRVHRAGLRMITVSDEALAGGEVTKGLKNAVSAAERSGLTAITVYNNNPVSVPKLISSSKS
ncbi:MAG: hypothetical protein Q7Q71_16195 [Verrucomicrobiota bacterium JB023]|nr:hypothetical protein [Verrucomicrobiota bacterium JB023]